MNQGKIGTGAMKMKITLKSNDAKMTGKKFIYKSDKIEVSYFPKLCIHAKECVKGLPAVFNPNKKPWIEPANGDPDRLTEIIERCPTGALKYKRFDSEKRENFSSEPKVTIVKDGPLYFKGDIHIIDYENKPIYNGGRMALCRCGASKNKPFCDNTHLEINFNGE